MQAVPQPYGQISLQRDGQELTRLHYGRTLNRPFLFPVNGPSGHMLTRMGHPGDPESHSHHNSVWISYARVNGIDFWLDRPGPGFGRILHQRIVSLSDGTERAGVVTESAWTSDSGAVLLKERRGTWAITWGTGNWLLAIDLELSAEVEKVVFDASSAATTFGPIGVRVAKTMSVQYGAGDLRSSSGAATEKDIFRRPARWVDYSGPVADGLVEGLTLFDHPENPGHPSPFHVRADGWMGAMLGSGQPLSLTRGGKLRLRYGLYVHTGAPAVEDLDAAWRKFAALTWPPADSAGRTR